MRDGLDLPAPVLWNATLAAFAHGLGLPQGGRVFAEPVPDLRPDPAAPAFVLRLAAGSVYLQPRGLPLGALTGSKLPPDALERLPPALADAVLELAFDRLLSRAAPAAQHSVKDRKRCAPTDMMGEETLLLRVDAGWDSVAEVLVIADRATICAATQGLLPPPARGAWPEAMAAEIHLPCSLRLFGPALTVSRLRRLAPGDIILTAGPQQWLCAPHARFGLAQDDINWTISEVSMTDDLATTDHGPAGAEAADIGDIPVRLSLLLAERDMTLAELQGLTKGALLPFAPANSDAGQSVQLLANGRCIGDGHIVDVDGQPALRIARLFGK